MCIVPINLMPFNAYFVIKRTTTSLLLKDISYLIMLETLLNVLSATRNLLGEIVFLDMIKNVKINLILYAFQNLSRIY